VSYSSYGGLFNAHLDSALLVQDAVFTRLDHDLVIVVGRHQFKDGAENDRWATKLATAGAEGLPKWLSRRRYGDQAGLRLSAPSRVTMHGILPDSREITASEATLVAPWTCS
jgi:hypothetical protein